eukprot:3218529-Amphidinium_carterae.1
MECSMFPHGVLSYLSESQPAIEAAGAVAPVGASGYVLVGVIFYESLLRHIRKGQQHMTTRQTILSQL